MTTPSRQPVGAVFKRHEIRKRLMEDLKKQKYGMAHRLYTLEELFSSKELHEIAERVDQETGLAIGPAGLDERFYETVFLEKFAELSPAFREIAELEVENDDLDEWKEVILRHEQREKKGVTNLLEEAQEDQRSRVLPTSIFSAKQRKEIAGANPDNFVGSAVGSEKSQRRARNLGRPPKMLSESVSPFKRNAIVDAKRGAMDDLAVARSKLAATLRGSEITEQEEKAIRRSPTRFSRGVSNAMETTFFGLNEAIKPFVKGILTHTDPKETPFFAEMERKRAELLSPISDKLANAPQCKNLYYLDMLKKMYEDLMQHGDYKHLLPQITSIQAEINKQKEVLQRMNEEEAKKLSDAIDTLNQEMFSKAKDLAEESDDMVKWRIFQIVLIASPFGLWNFMMPIANIFGPLFSATGTFGEGMASIVTSDVWGPFGQLAGYVEMDTVIQFIFDKVPLISDLGAFLKDIIAAGPTQELFGLMGPTMTGDPMIPLLIAAGFSLSRAKTEIEHSEKETKDERDMKRKFRKEFAKFDDKESVAQARASMRTFLESSIEKNLQVRLYAKHIADLVSFITTSCNTDEEREALKIFDDIKVKCSVEGEEEREYSLFELSEKVDLRDDENIARFLGLLPKVNAQGKEDGGLSARQDMMSRVAVFVDVAQEDLAAYQALGKDKVKSEGEKLMKHQLNALAIEVAKEQGIIPGESVAGDEELAAKDCKERMLVHELDKWEKFRKIAVPGQTVAEPETPGKPLNLGSQFSSPVLVA